MNLLYYIVTYETVIVAMMMTGKIIVGLLATAVFFSFFPAVGALIGGCLLYTSHLQMRS